MQNILYNFKMKEIEVKKMKKNPVVCLVGLGYVGLPIAVSFARKLKTIGYDINEEKIEIYKQGFDPTNEVGDEVIRQTTVEFTADEKRIGEADFVIVAVPTPVRDDKTPDLTALKGASATTGRNMKKGAIVVFESTVYPGATEEVCIPILEETSGLKHGVDFKVGFSPERINPGDKVNRLETIVKVVSGSDEESLEQIAQLYELIIDAGVHRAESIQVAEAAKVIENAQRDINIAFMNELSIIFNKLGIDTKQVLNAAKTKWNFLPFYPGLVGGHCIGIDPYYLVYKAKKAGYHPEVILSGRNINDGMGKYVAENIVKLLVNGNVLIQGAKVAILGLSFKENVPDTRNSKVVDIIEELREYEIEPLIVDPIGDQKEAKYLYDIEFTDIKDIKDMDLIVVAVAHDEFKSLTMDDFDSMLNPNNEKRILVDVKGLYNREQYESEGYIYFRL